MKKTNDTYIRLYFCLGKDMDSMAETWINSSELAKKIANTLGLSAAEEIQLYAELSQIPNGLLKTLLMQLF